MGHLSRANVESIELSIFYWKYLKQLTTYFFFPNVAVADTVVITTHLNVNVLVRKISCTLNKKQERNLNSSVKLIHDFITCNWISIYCKNQKIVSVKHLRRSFCENTKRFSAVNCFRQKPHIRCLIGFCTPLFSGQQCLLTQSDSVIYGKLLVKLKKPSPASVLQKICSENQPWQWSKRYSDATTKFFRAAFLYDTFERRLLPKWVSILTISKYSV